MPGRSRARSAQTPRCLSRVPQGHRRGPGRRGRPVADRGPGRRSRRRGRRSRRGATKPDGGAGSWRGRRCAGPRCAAGGRPPGHRADRPRVYGLCGSGVRGLRVRRPAIDPVRAGRGLPAVPQPAARDRLHPVRRGPAGRRADQQRRAGLRAVPPPRTRPPPLRDLREDRPDRCPRPRQQPRRVRELLPAAHSRLHDLRAAPGMPLRGHPADLPDLLAAVYGRVRPLRAGPPAGCPLARGTGLRHLLYGRPAPARHLRRLRPATAAGLPARTGSRHLRRLRRTDHHPCVRAVRRRGQAIREGPMCPLQPTAANRRPDPGPGRAGHAGPGHRTGSRRRSHRGRADPVLGTELAADRGRRRDSRRRGGRPHSPHPQGAR